MPADLDVLLEICHALDRQDLTAAAAVAREHLPPSLPKVRVDRKTRNADAVRIFLRDGFIDRYSGRRLIYPGALRLLSALMPAEFPYHPNWKTELCHPFYWERSPTLDHIVPIALGGVDTTENLVTTSMLQNARKAHWTLEQLGWTLLPCGNCRDWDGLYSWFTRYVGANPAVRENRGVRAWWAVANIVQLTP